MKVSDVLTESASTTLDNGTDFNDLSSRHIGTLRAIANGRLDFENASERMIEMLEELQMTGFITSDIQLTSSATKAIELAELLGGSKERRRAASMGDVEISDDDIYIDDYANSEDDVGFDSIYQANRFGAHNPNQI